MKQSRRLFLQTFGVGITAVSLPEVSSLLNWFSFPGGPDEDLSVTIHRLLLGPRAGGPFVAYADANITLGEPQRLLSAPSALLKMLDSLGFNRYFSDRVGYEDAAQCRDNFEAQVTEWRSPRYGFSSFTDVKRSASDEDVAVAVGGNIDSNNNLTQAAGSTQYQGLPAVALVKNDPIVAVATKWLLEKNLSGKELAQALAVTRKSEVAMDGDEKAMRYETPVTASVYIPRPPQQSRVENAVGVLAAHLKKAPNNVYVAEMYT
jgi:hypothetical protein